MARRLSQRCRFCGCTDSKSCSHGCWWVAENVCSTPSCVKKWEAEKLEKEGRLV